jgi:hypothetical protein
MWTNRGDTPFGLMPLSQKHRSDSTGVDDDTLAHKAVESTAV